LLLRKQLMNLQPMLQECDCSGLQSRSRFLLLRRQLLHLLPRRPQHLHLRHLLPSRMLLLLLGRQSLLEVVLGRGLASSAALTSKSELF
jgi:hypothetical protein